MRSKKALVLGVLAAAVAAVVLGPGAGSAFAAYTASVQNGTLNVVGDGASDKLALRLAPGDPQTLQLDVGDDGTADFAFDRNTFTAVNVQGGGGDSTRSDQHNGLLPDDAAAPDGGGRRDTPRGGGGAATPLSGSG